jgi:polar amino acid transport system substrate-binding protein
MSHARDLAEIQKDKKLKIAVDTTYPPMEFESADGKIIGLDVDLAKEIAKQLNVTAEFIVMPWDGILAGLASNRYDIIMSSMNITDERSAQVNFVPYISMGQVFITKSALTKVKSEKDLAGRVVAVQADTTSYTALENFKKNGIKIKDIKAFKGATEAFSAVKSGQAEVILIDEAVGLYYASLDSKTFIVTGEALKPEPIGIAIRKSDKELHKAISGIVKKMKDDGTFKKIYKSWLKADPK